MSSSTESADIPRGPAIVSLEGNIASGKSTLLHAVSELIQKESVKCNVADEAVSEWMDSGMFQLFLKDPKYAPMFQMGVTVSRHNHIAKAVAGADMVLCARGPLSERYVFARKMYDEGHFSPPEWTTYLRQWITLLTPVHLVVFIHVPAQVCLDRCRARDRSGETVYDLPYFQDLERRYEELKHTLIGENGTTRVLSYYPEEDEAVETSARAIAQMILSKLRK